MSQIAQLSEAEIEERFHITGKTAVQFMLLGFVRERDAFNVQFGPEHEQFPTRLLGILADKGQLVFDCSGSPDLNRRLRESEQSLFIGRPGGIQVQFSVGPAIDVHFEGARAFAVPLPKRLMRLQRRENFRIETPRVQPLQFFGRLPEGTQLNLSAHDISVSGLGLAAATLPDELLSGVRMDKCRITLPEDSGPLFAVTSVRHITEQASRSGQRHWRIGLVFDDLPVADQNRIQRYIVRIEHERHELS